MREADGADQWLRNLLENQQLSFHDFVELALYDPDHGYYARSTSPIGRTADFITSPELSPVFSFAVARLCREFLSRTGDGLSAIVDIGCGDGALIRSLSAQVGGPASFFGIDRFLNRIAAGPPANVDFITSVEALPRDVPLLLFSNELYDAMPFARLVRRPSGLNELWVTAAEGALDWAERPSSAAYIDYFESRGVPLEEGQFADISLEWERVYSAIASIAGRGLIVTFDYGFPESTLFHPRARRFGTAAAYSGHRVSRDLLANPGRQDLTAHINFSDLIRAGESQGFETLFFDRQAKFLLALGITEHELFTPINNVEIESAADGVALLERRDAARQLVLPDGIGHDIRVLVQGRGMGAAEWSFQRPLFGPL